jgi:kynurenine 3-monooxygenase
VLVSYLTLPFLTLPYLIYPCLKTSGCPSGHAHGYKEMLFPVGSGLISHGLHIWPRTRHMLMALANRDGSMTGTLYMDQDGGSESFDELKDTASATAFFEKHYADAIPMIGGVERAVEQMVNNPKGLLGTVRTSVWNTRGRVVLLGDAAHALVPFFGQGMNCGFEDVHEIIKVNYVVHFHCYCYIAM